MVREKHKVCIYKHKDFGNWKIKSDVYVAGLWFLVRFGGECESYIRTLGCFRVHNFQCNGVLDETRTISLPESSFPLTSGWKTRGLGATILKYLNSGDSACIYGACLKWLLPEHSFSDRWSRGTRPLGTRLRRGRQRDKSRVLVRMPGWINLLPVAALARPVLVS